MNRVPGHVPPVSVLDCPQAVGEGESKGTILVGAVSEHSARALREVVERMNYRAELG